MGGGEGEETAAPLCSPCSLEWAPAGSHRAPPSAGMGTRSPATRLPSRRVLKSKRILPGEMKFPLFLINP